MNPLQACLKCGDHLLMTDSCYGPARNFCPTNPARIRSATRWQAEGPILRLHIGLEDPADLIADLEGGFHALRQVAGS